MEHETRPSALQDDVQLCRYLRFQGYRRQMDLDVPKLVTITFGILSESLHLALFFSCGRYVIRPDRSRCGQHRVYFLLDTTPNVSTRLPDTQTKMLKGNCVITSSKAVSKSILVSVLTYLILSY